MSDNEREFQKEKLPNKPPIKTIDEVFRNVR